MSDLKPTSHIGSSTGFKVKAFQAVYASMCKVTNPDCVICGSDALAEDIRATCRDLSLDMTVIVDDGLSPKRYWLTTLDALSKIPGGGRN